MPQVFTYDGSPQVTKGDKYTTLDREVVQSNRFFLSKQNGTHARTALRVNIPRNSGRGIGVGHTQTQSSQPQLRN